MVGLQIEEDSSIGMSSPKSKIIHAQNAGSWGQRALLFGSSQKRVSTRACELLLREASQMR